MLKKSASCVLASFRGSTYQRRRQGTYPLACDRSERFKRSLVCTSSALRSLRPCRTALLNMLRGIRVTQLRRKAIALMFVGVTGLLALSSPAIPPLHAQDYPPDITRGKAVYVRHCQSCHGVSGYGDGPAAAALKVTPANFHRFRSFQKSDEELLRTIEHGIVFSPMHSWRGQLTDGEMQDVVAYIRLLSQQGQ